MALANSADVRPSSILAITMNLVANRANKSTRSELLAMSSPPGLATSDEDATKSMNAALEIGFLTADNATITAPESTIKAVARGLTSAVDELRRVTLDERNNLAPWGQVTGARDVTNALAWLLTVDERGTLNSGTRAEDAMRIDFGARSEWIFTATRWPAIPRWAVGLGFARVDPNGDLVPDPTVAIAQSLPAVMGSVGELAAPVFMQRLAEILPVLDGGSYRTHVEQHSRSQDPNRTRLSASLSRALLRLDSAGLIELGKQSDAATITLVDGRTVSHIERRKR